MKKNIEEAERIARTATVPHGYKIEPMADAGYVIVIASGRFKNSSMAASATIDAGARTVRLGLFMTQGESDVSELTFTGPGWRQRLVDAAVAKLQEVARG